MSNVGVSVGNHSLWTWEVLRIAEKTVGGLVHPDKIEEMDSELTRVIEDFDRAVNIEVLRLTKETGEHSYRTHSKDLSSIVSCRARVFAWETEICRGWS